MVRQFDHLRLLGVLVLVLFCFLALSAALISEQEKDLLRRNTLNDVEGDLEIMADASVEALLKSDYVAVRNFIEQWGGKRRECRELRIVAPNGFVIAEYRSPDEPAGETYTLVREVVIEKTRLATISLRGDYYQSDTLMAALRNKLIVVAFIITGLLGAALWSLFRRMAIVPLEEAVQKRTVVLEETVRELDQLANNSPT
jgi:hypothetical protein